MDMEWNLISEKSMNFLKFFLRILYAYLEAFWRFFVPPPMRSLTGEIILVTGSAKGIGEEICRQLAQSKVTLVMWDCDQLKNEKTTKEFKTRGVRVFSYNVDISDRQQVELTAAKVREEVGDVTIVINNAGISPISDFLKTSPDLIEKTFQINVLSHFSILREFLPRMIDNHHGHIATVCSIGGMRAMGGSVPYYGSKFAVHGYIEALKLHLDLLNCHGIRFTTIYPYFVDTGMVKDVKFSKDAGFLPKLLPFLKPSEVAIKLIEGIRRNYEYVYCPAILPYILQLDNLLPLKLRREIALSFEEKFQHPNFADRQQRIKAI